METKQDQNACLSEKLIEKEKRHEEVVAITNAEYKYKEDKKWMGYIF